MTRNWGKTVVNWNLALDPRAARTTAGAAPVPASSRSALARRVTSNAEYYALGHLARFVRPGAVRIASTSFGTTGWNGQIMDAAFRNRDGSTALVVHNENDEPRRLRRRPGRLVVRVHVARRRARDVHVAGLAGARRRPRPAGRSPPPARAEHKAADDDATTRWTPGAAQAPGQSLQVDLGRVQRVRRVVLDTGADTGDFPRSYALLTSTDGTHWSGGAPGRRRRAAGPRSTSRRPAARFVQVVQTATAPQWWSVAEVRIYR